MGGGAMKLPLQLLASILLTSVCATGWPYHEIVGVGQSAARVFVAPVYGVAPAVSLLPAEPAKEASTIVAGPVTGTTIVKVSSSGPVTVLSPGQPIVVPENAPSSTENTTDAAGASEDSVLIKGASAGPVTLVAPSANSVPDNAPSAVAETKKGTVATSAEAEAVVRIENAGESSSARATANATAISETIGTVSAKAVIGPSTGPIIIAGPTGPPLPVAVAASTVPPSPVAVAASAVSFASAVVANASVSNSIAVPAAGDGPAPATEPTEPPTIEGASSSPSSSSQNSGAVARAQVNLIAPAAVSAAEAPPCNVLVSAQTVPPALVSGPLASVSASAVLLEAPLYSL